MRRLVTVGVLAGIILGAVGTTSSADAAPTKVYVGAYVNDIQNLNLDNGTYFVDFYIWMRWKGLNSTAPAENVDLINSYDLWGTVVTPLSTKQMKLSDGSNYRLNHYEGLYNTTLPLQNYPFDVEKLTVVMENAEDPVSKVVYVLDPRQPITQASDLGMPGYRTGKATLTVAEQAYPTNFGAPGASNESYSRITITVPVSRPWFPYAIKYLLPLLVVLVAAAMVFLVPPRFIEGRFGLAITALLTVIALKWTTDAELPNVDYLTLLDVLYVISLLFVILTIAVATYSAWQINHGRDDSEVVSVDRWALLIGGLMVIVAGAAAILIYLT